jgi:hypothetical protein
MRSHRLVAATLNFNSRGTIVAGIRANAIERDAVKMKQMRWPKFDLAVR